MVYIKWDFSYLKLFKTQQKIQKFVILNPRKCRNFQRILRRSHLVQLLIINEILQFQIKQSKFKIQTLKEKIIFSKLTQKKYQEFLRQQITTVLWTLAFSPLVKQKRNYPKIYSTDNSSELYETLYRFFQQSSANYIFINQFSNLFNNKYAILSNLLIENKFFLYWLKSKKNSNFYSNITFLEKSLKVSSKKPIVLLRLKFLEQINKIDLKKLIKNFINLNFLDFFENEINLSNYPMKNNNPNCFQKNPKKSYYFFQYNNRILIALEKTKEIQILQNSINSYAQYYKLNIFYQNSFSINQGLNCLGWFFIKKSNKISVSISKTNFKNHQYEIQKYLKMNRHKTIDRMIYELNNKIISWQKFYHFSNIGTKNMNDFLFWQIWYWIKKRYKNKSAKWLYKRYWKNSTSKNWIFAANNETLFLYKN